MNKAISEIKRVFTTRLDALEHILGIGDRHFAGDGSFMDKRLDDDMLPFAAQVAFACNQSRGFSQWCAGEAIDNLAPDSIETVEQARTVIAQTRDLVSAIPVDDAKLDEIKRVGLGPGRYCELTGHRYVADWLMPNLYFHITAAYAILRMLGAPVGKTDFLLFLAPEVKQEDDPMG
jgi:uncharacterized protein